MPRRKPTEAEIVESLGALPYMLSSDDPRPAREQFNERYGFAGGWRPFRYFTLGENNELIAPRDPEEPDEPPLFPVADGKLRDELILFYPHAWVAIVQPDRSFEVCRMD